MKTLIRILLALSLSAQWPAFADSPTPALGHSAGKSSQNKDRKVFGAYVARKMADAFDGKLATMYPCGNKPAYSCQGLMVTAFESDDPYWMDPKTARISFTYFRQDIATPLFANAGLVLWPQAYLDHDFPMVGQDHQAFRPNYRCAYPTDGDTDIRSNSGCGAQILDGKIVPDTAPCASLGITTGQQWIDKYGAIPGSICGFALNPANGSDRRGMEAMIQADAAIRKIGNPVLFPWNEVVMGPWPSYAPDRIPLMAFFFVPYKQEARSAAHEARPGAREKASTPGTQHERGPARHYALTFAQQQQKRYYDLTKIFVPLIEISEASPNAVFTYWDSEQAAGIPGIVTTMPQ